MQTHTKMIARLGALVLLIAPGLAQEAGSSDRPAKPQAPAAKPLDVPTDEPTLEGAARSIEAEVRAAEEELAKLRERSTDELVPLRTKLTELERELLEVEEELKTTKRDANADALKLTNLTKTIDQRRDQATRLTNLLGEYARNFESRLHIAELQRYDETVDGVLSAPEDESLSQSEIYARQATIIDTALDRLFELGGGTVFEGQAVDPEGLVRDGRVALVGPVAIFRSEDGSVVGTAEQRIGSLSANVTSFDEEEDTVAAAELVTEGEGLLPFDGSLGNAHKVAQTKETFLEHVEKGGVIIYPILGMAALALMVALYKWITLMFVRKPSKKKLNRLLEAVAEGDEESARRRVEEIKGPTGKMLQGGVDTMRRSRDLMEEVMYEKVITTKAKVQGGLPFIAICAASAPLLGLLGTVTGIINTFKQITIFGSGDVKSLSGGISEALITTKFGLIVAIPSLLLHAYLSRRARGVTTQMEVSAVKFANEVAKSDEFGEVAEERRRVPVSSMLTPEHELVRGQVSEILNDMLGPLSSDGNPAPVSQAATRSA